MNRSAAFALLSVAAAGIMLSAAPAPATKPATAMARYTGPGNKYPERWDDIFWENDRTAHRIYGPALAVSSEKLVTSGIDVWVKKTRDLFMDEQLRLGQHDDHGKGMDCYDVQLTCGCGGLGIWDDKNKKLIRSANWDQEKILQNGPDVASFWVAYKEWDISANSAGRKVKEERTFTLPTGTNFTRMVDTISDTAQMSGEYPELLVGIGIAKRKLDDKKFKGPEGVITTDKEKGLLVYWEPEQFNGATSFGHTGCAVLVDPKSIVKFVTDDPLQSLVIVKVTPGKPWVYYSGACWDQGLDFHSRAEWEKYASDYKSDFDAAKK